METQNGEPDISKRSVWKRCLDSVFGYDYFISYRWVDGREFAVQLARKLEERGFEVFLDSDDFATGDDWKQIGRWTLKRTGQLILVCTQGALESPQEETPVEREVRIFSQTERRILPISFSPRDESGQLNNANSTIELAREHSRVVAYISKETLAIHEGIENLLVGPSEKTIDTLRRSFNLVRQDRKRSNLFASISAALLTLTVIAIVAAIQTKFAKDEEARQKVVAEEAKVVAEEAKVVAEEAKVVAEESLAQSQHELALNSIERAIAGYKSKDRNALLYLYRAYQIANRLVIQGNSIPPDESLDRSVRRLMAGRQPNAGLELIHGDLVGEFHLSPDGNFIRTLGINYDGEPAGLYFWDSKGRLIGDVISIDDNFSYETHMSRDWGSGVMWNGYDDFKHFNINDGVVRWVASPALGEKDVFGPSLYAPDGTIYVTKIDGIVEFWDTNSGERLHELDVPVESLDQLTFSLDAAYAVSSVGENVRIFDARTGTIHKSLIHKSEVQQVVMAANNSRLVTVDSDDRIYIWSVQAGSLVKCLEIPAQSSPEVKISPDSTTVLLKIGKSAYLADCDDGKMLAGPLTHESPIVFTEFSRSGRRLLTMDSAEDSGSSRPFANCLREWDVFSGKKLMEFSSRDQNESAKFSPDGKLVLLKGKTMFRVIDSETGNIRAGPWKTRHEISWMSDGTSIITASKVHARVVKISRKTIPTSPLDHPPNTEFAMLSQRGQLLVTISSDADIRPIRTDTSDGNGGGWKHPSPIVSAKLVINGKYLVTRDDNDVGRVWETLTGKLLQTVGGLETEDWDADILAEGNFWIGRTGEGWQKYRVDDTKTVERLPIEKEDNLVALSPNSLHALVNSGWARRDVRLITTADGTSRTLNIFSSLVENYDEPEYIAAVAFSDTSQRLATATSLGSVCIWEVESGQLILKLQGPTSGVGAMAFSANGEMLATGHGTNLDNLEIVRLWDVNTGRMIRGFTGFERDIVSIAFSDDDLSLYASSIARTIRFAVPELPDDPDRIRAWVSVQTGSNWSPNGTIEPIRRTDSWRELDALGGPF